MLTLLALTLMAPQITDPYEDPAKAEQKIVDDGLKEVVSIDRELGEIKENADELSRSKALLDDEVASLKVRYPGIVIPVRATTAQVYRALQDYREVRASQVRPILERRVLESRKKVCAAANSVRSLQKDLEETDEYKRATLSERMEIRRNFDTFKRLPDGSVCPQ